MGGQKSLVGGLVIRFEGDRKEVGFGRTGGARLGLGLGLWNGEGFDHRDAENGDLRKIRRRGTE